MAAGSGVKVFQDAGFAWRDLITAEDAGGTFSLLGGAADAPPVGRAAAVPAAATAAVGGGAGGRAGEMVEPRRYRRRAPRDPDTCSLTAVVEARAEGEAEFLRPEVPPTLDREELRQNLKRKRYDASRKHHRLPRAAT